MCLSLLVFTQLFLKVVRSEARQTGAKTEFNAKFPFKVIQGHVTHYGITEKPITDCMSLYNNVGLISKVSEEIARDNVENCCYWQPLGSLSFDAPWNPREYPHKLYSARKQSHGLHYCRYSMDLSSFNFFCGGLRKTHLFCNRVHIGRSRSSKVVDFGTNRKRVCDFPLAVNSNFGPILHRFWDAATYWLKIANFCYPTQQVPSVCPPCCWTAQCIPAGIAIHWRRRGQLTAAGACSTQ